MRTNRPVNAQFPSIYRDGTRVRTLLQTFPIAQVNIPEYTGVLQYSYTKARPLVWSGPSSRVLTLAVAAFGTSPFVWMVLYGGGNWRDLRLVTLRGPLFFNANVPSGTDLRRRSSCAAPVPRFDGRAAPSLVAKALEGFRLSSSTFLCSASPGSTVARPLHFSSWSLRLEATVNFALVG